VFSFVKYLRKRSGSAVTAMTKACSACGQVMSATEFSCPRCFTLQTDVNQGRGR
jgi:Zn finger protein HypA/HybF involved in hydrogenase expression